MLGRVMKLDKQGKTVYSKKPPEPTTIPKASLTANLGDGNYAGHTI